MRLLTAFENSPILREKLTEISNRYEQEIDGEMNAYEAETRIVEAVRKIGRSMMGQWAQKAQSHAGKRTVGSILAKCRRLKTSEKITPLHDRGIFK